MEKTKEELKTVFVTGAKPTQADFADLIRLDACSVVCVSALQVSFHFSIAFSFMKDTSLTIFNIR